MAEEDLLPVIGVHFGGGEGNEDGDSSDSEIDADEQREDADAASDNEEDEEEMETKEKAQPPDINYDPSLPGTHSYLGTDLEEVRGRTVHEDDSYLNLPLLPMPGVVLVPGQTLPLQLFQQSIVSMVRRIVESDKTFGLVTARYSPTDFSLVPDKIGTTAEIFSYKEENDDLSGITMLRVKAMGRQRFEVMEKRRQTDGILMGKVRILPEKILPPALEGARLGTQRYFPCSCDTERQSAETPGGQGDRQRLREQFFGTQFKRKKPKKFSEAHYTWWPSWVYRQYDAQELVTKVRRELKSWNETLKLSNMPSDPVEFSYWVAGILPIDDSMKILLISVDCAVQRLRCELSIMQKCTVFICRFCGHPVTNKRDVFSMALEGPMAAYVNPGGYVHETLTVYKAQGLVLRGGPSTENSWFPGYAWTIVECRSCNHHMGWKFTAVKKKHKPEKFWGLVRASLQPGFLATEEEGDEWRPTL